jgi:peptidoglycan L-alanyl-D-glutamate endopeptidase CwlK
MPNFSPASRAQLDTCNPVLRALFEVVVQRYDCTIIEGRRDKRQQDLYYQSGKSKVQWPESKHNVLHPDHLSIAVDVAPYEMTEIDWSRDQCLHFGGYVKGVADSMGIKIRWGGDWDLDNDVQDQTFNDLVHYELLRP